MIERVKELIENKSFMELRGELLEMNAADIAAILEDLSNAETIRIFRLLPKDLAAEVFSYLSIEVEQFIITSLTAKEAGLLIDNMFADDAADLMDEMPANVVTRLLAHADPETRRDINHLLQYPEDSAGSIMTVEYVSLKEGLTVSQAIDRIRKDAGDSADFNVCYVLDVRRKLIGTVELRDLILANPDTLVGDVMNENFIFVHTHDDQEEVAQAFQKYDCTAMPVVDRDNRLVGIITIDDIVDIIEQEATEDIEMMAAITPTDKPYMKTGVFETWKKRVPWLLLLMISATFTGQIIQHYEDALGAYIVLTSFIPMLMDTGGNAGSQASVTIIRGLSLNELEFSDIWAIMWKEFRVSICCGITLAAANFIKLLLVDRVSIMIAAVVCITLASAVIVAKLVGCTLPVLAKKIGFDPAVMASPFITTIVDALSLMIYFTIATHLLGI
ncbi:MAG: magnesium transporter [Lachnospiraceae bacterium]|nr:magnesium transporter [Lachnospiraceae bacterium]